MNTLLNLIKLIKDDGQYVIGKIIFMLWIQMKPNINISLKDVKNGIRLYKNPKPLIEYSNNIQDVYKNIDEDNPENTVNHL